MTIGSVEPHFTLINTSRGTKPAVVVVNTALRGFTQRDAFPWHLNIVITCRDLAGQGMPTASENQVLYSIEDEISAELLAQDNALFVFRVTCDGARELAFRVRDPDIADGKLQRLVSVASPLREWMYTLEEDVAWKLPQPELRLLEKDPRFN